MNKKINKTKRKINKTKRKINKTKRKINKTKRKIKVIRRKRNNGNLHNKLMKGGSAAPGGGDANLFGLPISNWFFHDPPPPLSSISTLGSNTFRVNKAPTFNIVDIFDFLGIILPVSARTGVGRTLIRFDQNEAVVQATQSLSDINFDIKRNGQGFNLIIEYFYLTIYLEQLEQGSPLFVSPSIKFNIKKMLQNYLISIGMGDSYSEAGGLTTIYVIEPLRDTDISIRFEYTLSPANGELKLLRNTVDRANNSKALIIGTTGEEAELELRRGLSINTIS
jgi:hypothetical protein